MRMKDIVKIAPRYQKAIRIDSDLKSVNAVRGFVCPRSSAEALLSMVLHVCETHQGAYTWTGPYGTGKSSLVVCLGNLLGGYENIRQAAREALGEHVADKILQRLAPDDTQWRVLPVVGRRDDPARVIGEAIIDSKLVTGKRDHPWTEQEVITTLANIAGDSSGSHAGLIVFIDEMGKFLEGAANEGSDIYFFQQLAEIASRSEKRLIVVGVLHQAFEDYAHRLSREMRDEWSKIQGRFIDLPVSIAGEEQIDLLARAIKSTRQPSSTEEIAQIVANIIHQNKRGVSTALADLLAQCWPLHPVVACLLGSISRRRFGQNQRSIFGFLNSAEPYAFQDFLARADGKDIYTVDQLWEYLRTNLESSILASPDGHRWALAVEAIERCEAQVTDELPLLLLKTISLIGLFKGNTGLVANPKMLAACHPQFSADQIQTALDDLKRWSYLIYKTHLRAYAIYAGSDFDIDDAVRKAHEEIREIDFQRLKKLAGLQPILAKRHYHTTGALRWFDVELVPLKDVVDAAASFTETRGTIGQFLLAVPTENETREYADELCAKAARTAVEWKNVIGLSKQSWTVRELAMEILATEKVHNENIELGGDSVARREVRARISELQGELEAAINKAFDRAVWRILKSEPQELSRTMLSVVASDLADTKFPQSPKILNELLNRIKPSNTAVAAQNILLRRMVQNEGQARLGIEGFPAEGGLFASLLEASKLYDNNTGIFQPPSSSGQDPCNLAPLWQDATSYLRGHSSRTVQVSEIFDRWRMPPFGVRDGLMPTLAVAYILSERKNLAFYRDGIFQSRLRDIDTEVLAKAPSAIQLRYINLSDVSKKFLSGMAEIVRKLDPGNTLKNLEPIDVARGLVAIFDSIHPWALRTMHLSKEAVRIRNLFKKASDPNKFLFDDIPALLEESGGLDNEQTLEHVVSLVYQALKELQDAYPSEIQRIRDLMLAELQVPNVSPQALAELRGRAENARQLSGDFRLEAFVGRLANFTGCIEDIEGIASLAANKPPKVWVDNDIDRAKIEITALSQQFLRAETFARIKGRADKRQSLSVIIGMNGRPTPLHCDFEVMNTDRGEINKIIREVQKAITQSANGRKVVVLAALAELSARYIELDAEVKSVKEMKAVL